MKNDVVDRLTSLIRIPSVSRLSNRLIIDYAVEALHQAQWQTRQLPYTDATGVEKINLVAAPSGQNIADPTPELAFICHTDTVPYAPDWAKATDPFVSNGLLYGCGACDVKGFLACLLTAITATAPSKLIDGLRLILTADEEIGCIGITRLLASGLLRPRRAVVGEPTSLHPARAGKGYCLAEVTVFGQEAHSALPHRGKSAIYRAARLITAIEDLSLQLAQEQHSFFSPNFTTLNIGTIHGGAAKNIIPGQCSFQLEWRPIPGQPADAVPAAVAAAAKKLQAADPDFRWNLNITRQQGGFETGADSRLIQSIETLTGREATSIPFGSEASLLAAVAEEIVVFGPGDMQTAHSSRECVPLSELHDVTAVLESLMTQEVYDDQ
jgi:acetylornithine deacetylase